MKYVSTFFSWMLHPLLMVTYCAFIFLFFIPSDFEQVETSLCYRILLQLFISTFLLPVLFTLVMKRMGHISNLQMESQKERNWPLLQTTIIYIGAYYAIQNRAVPAFIQLFLLGSIIGILFSLIVNLKWKISLHLIGAGGLCGGISALMIAQQAGNPLVLAICFLLTGMLGTARLFLKAHSPAQVLAGFLAGFAIEFSLIFFAFS